MVYICFDSAFYVFWVVWVCLISLKNVNRIASVLNIYNILVICASSLAAICSLDFCLCSLVEIHKILCREYPFRYLTCDCNAPIHVHLTVLCALSKAGHPPTPPGEHALPIIRAVAILR